MTNIPEIRQSTVSLRRSRDVVTSQPLALIVGMWVVIGVFGLHDTVIRMSGVGAAWAYLISAVAILPIALTHIELRSHLRMPERSSYFLIRQAERPGLSFLTGWMYFLGWFALNTLFALAYANTLGAALTLLPEPIIVDTRLLAAAALVLFAVINLFGQHPAMSISTRMMLLVLAAIVAFSISLIIRSFEIDLFVTGIRTGQGRFFRAVLVLVSAMWTMETVARYGTTHNSRPQRRLIQIAFGPIVAAFFMFASNLYNPRLLSLHDLAANFSPVYGPLILIVIEVVAIALTWQVTTIIMQREMGFIGEDGILPNWILKSNKRGIAPPLIILQTILSLLLLTLGQIDIVAQIAAGAFLVLEIGVCATSIFVFRTGIKAPEPSGSFIFQLEDLEDQKPFRLPFFPLIQAMGIAVSLLLMFALNPLLLFFAFGWALLGVILYVRVGQKRLREMAFGVTVFQDVTVRPNLTTDYAVIVPIEDPEKDQGLIAMGAVLAQQHNGHVVVVQVIPVPPQVSIEREASTAEEKLASLEAVLETVEEYGAQVEGIVRFSHSVARGILDTSLEESAKVILLGWSPEDTNETILDAVLEGAAADVIMLNGHLSPEIHHVLVPVSGGQHAPRAAEIALSLTEPVGGTVTLINIVRKRFDDAAAQEAEVLLQETKQQLSAPDRVETQVIRVNAPVQEVIANESKNYDLLMLGTSEIGILERRAVGDFQKELAKVCASPVALIRAHTGMGAVVARRTFNTVADLLPSLSDQEMYGLFDRMKVSATPSINYFVLITLSAIIATLGLLLNSPAVVIGAMLVAPLMSPIVAVAVGITFGNERILRDAVTSTVQGAAAAIFVATLVAVIVPGNLLTSEVLARTQPTLIDLMVALFSGMAGAYAIARREVGEALPGVAIAAALVPPLGTVGVGIALGNASVAFGALLLFTTNFVAIVFAASAVFLLLGVRPAQQRAGSQQNLIQGLRYSIIALTLISIPLGVVLFQTIRQDRIQAQARQMIEEQVAEWNPNAQLVDYAVAFVGNVFQPHMEIEGTVFTSDEEINYDVVALREELEAELRPDVSLNLLVVQGQYLNGAGPGVFPVDVVP